MTKEITKAYILQQIQDKFKLRDLEPEVFRFLESVMPVYNIEPHLTKFEKKTVDKVITATGGKSFFLVPETEKWKIHRYNIIFVSGSFKVAGLMIGRPALVNYVYVDLTKNQTVSYCIDLHKPLVVQSRETIYVNIDDYTSTGTLTLILDVEIEELR